MAFPPPVKPKTLLGYYRLLSPTAAVRVSPICLGALNFGGQWPWLGECTKETAFDMLDYFYESGGNFVDTANSYQGQQSEIWLGEWIASRKCRDQMVLATKYTTGFSHGDGIRANSQGNHAKSLRVSVEASLRKLQTDYIDILYVHWWDWTTSIPELMQSLNRQVAAGRVLYLGISDTPAWVVSKANEYARCHGLTQFSVYQGLWNAAERDVERDILPMCQAEGMGIAPWGVLGRGLFKTEEQFQNKEGNRAQQAPEKAKRVILVLDRLAKQKDSLVTSIALAYVMHKAPYVFPILGGRKVEHLKANVEALSIKLSREEIAEIDAAEPFDIGFPMNILFEWWGDQKYHIDMTTTDMPVHKGYYNLDSVKKLQAVEPHDANDILMD